MKQGLLARGLSVCSACQWGGTRKAGAAVEGHGPCTEAVGVCAGPPGPKVGQRLFAGVPNRGKT